MKNDWRDAFPLRRGTRYVPGLVLEWLETPRWHRISRDKVLGGKERLGKKKWLDSPSARPLLLTRIFDFSPNRIIRVLLGSNILMFRYSV